MRAAEGGKNGSGIMGKGRDKRKLKAIQRRIIADALAVLRGSDPPILGEPDAPVYAPLKPKPNLRSGAVALPKPEPEDAFLIVKPRRLSK